MNNSKNSPFLQALRREKSAYTPTWIMRQAGRYLPEYRQTREKAGSFMRLCQTPELAMEVTLQPMRRFNLDAAIVFSDILTIPDAMGLELSFVEGEGPRFARPITQLKEIEALRVPVVAESLAYVLAAVKLIRAELKPSMPLIGFAGSPFTLAAYMLEGGASKNFSRAKSFLYTHPQAMHQLLLKLTDATAAYLSAQIEAGVDVVMIFDSWGGILSTSAYLEFSHAAIANIIARLKRAHPTIPIIVYTRGGYQCFEALADLGSDALGLDLTVSLQAARQALGERVALQGNLDPCVLLASKSVIQQEVRRILEAFGPSPGHIFNLGQGILPDTDPNQVAWLVDTVHEWSSRQ